MKNKLYKYKGHTFRAAEKNLEFRKNNFHFLSSLTEYIKDIKDEKELADKLVEFLHDESNLKNIFTTFLEKDAETKIQYDYSDDSNYDSIMKLAGDLLKDFFLRKSGSAKRSTP